MERIGGPERDVGFDGGTFLPRGGGGSAILVVEDDADFRELLVEHLVGTGHKVLSVHDGVEALAAIARRGHEFGLILLDLRMPRMDGFEVCKYLERSRLGIPVVVLTAEQETRDISASPAVIAVLDKPLDVPKLDALVAARFEERPAQRFA